MSRQSQDLYTSMQTAHNKIDKLDKRIFKLEGGIVANANALADLEYRHLKRIEALEEKHNHKPIFDRLDELAEANNTNADRTEDRLSALEKQAKPFDGWFENLHKRMSHQECPSPLLLDLVQRVCALDGGSDYEVHEKPLSCCEGCANKECGIRGRYGGDRRPCCYQLQFGLHSCCVGCINWPCPECQVPESIDDFRRRVAEMKCYREKKTCRTCW